jgi:hypothetical protein
MKTNSVRRIALQLVLASTVCGATYGVTGCLSAAATNFNPCGSILTCDPAEWDLMLMDTSQPNYDYNPTCPLPGLLNCDTPLVGGGTSTTGTTTGTTNTSSSTRNSGTSSSTRGSSTSNSLLGGFGT